MSFLIPSLPAWKGIEISAVVCLLHCSRPPLSNAVNGSAPKCAFLSWWSMNVCVNEFHREVPRVDNFLFIFIVGLFHSELISCCSATLCNFFGKFRGLGYKSFPNDLNKYFTVYVRSFAFEPSILCVFLNRRIN